MRANDGIVSPMELIALANGSSRGLRVTPTATATAMTVAMSTAIATRKACVQDSVHTWAERSTRKSHTRCTPKMAEPSSWAHTPNHVCAAAASARSGMCVTRFVVTVALRLDLEGGVVDVE